MAGDDPRRLTGPLEFFNGDFVHVGMLAAALNQAGWDDAAKEILRRARSAAGQGVDDSLCQLPPPVDDKVLAYREARKRGEH